MKTKFTPGPWTAINEPYEDGKPYWNIRAGRGFYCDDSADNGFHVQGIFSNANATLIAAAPEMYDNLEMILDMMEAMGQTNSIQYRQSRETLKKARGE